MKKWQRTQFPCKLVSIDYNNIIITTNFASFHRLRVQSCREQYSSSSLTHRVIPYFTTNINVDTLSHHQPPPTIGCFYSDIIIANKWYSPSSTIDRHNIPWFGPMVFWAVAWKKYSNSFATTSPINFIVLSLLLLLSWPANTIHHPTKRRENHQRTGIGCRREEGRPPLKLDDITVCYPNRIVYGQLYQQSVIATSSPLLLSWLNMFPNSIDSTF